MYEARKRMIFDILQKQGTVKVGELSRLLEVSQMTVRRDIQTMEIEGLLRRVHGGAAQIIHVFDEKPFASREVERQDRKQAIAKLAISLIQEGESLFLDGSTSTAELAKLLPGREHLVITDSLSVLNYLSRRKGIELVVLGGALDKDGNTFDGILAAEGAKQIHVDCCVFSGKGFSLDGVSNAEMVGVQVKQILIAQAMRTILLADSSKFGQSGIIRICSWEEVDILVTDNHLPQEVQDSIRAAGIKVLAAEICKEENI
jgi:DeoR/GlpR family transcriptional regulator of sugar metabolism